MLEIFEVIFEIYIGNQLVSRQIMQAPKEVLKVHFINTANQFKDDERPIKIKMIREKFIWDKFNKVEKQINNYVEIINRAMEMFENENRRN